jgi:hypothetical protein
MLLAISAQMAAQQEKARQLIDGMARFPQAESAVKPQSHSVGIDHANHNYQVLAQAVNGQARLSSQTVRSLLSSSLAGMLLLKI